MDKVQAQEEAMMSEFAALMPALAAASGQLGSGLGFSGLGSSLRGSEQEEDDGLLPGAGCPCEFSQC